MGKIINRIKENVYYRVALTNIATPFFYLTKIPFIIYYFIKSKITKTDNMYMNMLPVLNTLRIETRNYDKGNEKVKHAFKCYYRFDNRNVYVKMRFFKKVDETEYENFRNSVDMHCNYGVSELSVDRGYYYFAIYINLEPIYEYSITRQSIAVGTGYSGLTMWNYADYPHMLIIGDTGQGKSVFVRYLLNQIFKNGYEVWCIDGKKIDYAKVKDRFKVYTPNASTKEEIIHTLEEFKNNMQARYDDMVARGLYSYTEDTSLQPVFMLIDEYLMLVETADKKELTQIKQLISEIIWLGRGAGYFLITTMQRADAKYIDGAIRDNYACKVIVGNASKESYSMIFDRKLRGFKKGKAWAIVNNRLQIIAIPFYKDFDY